MLASLLSTFAVPNGYTKKALRDLRYLRVSAGAARKLELEKQLARLGSACDDSDVLIRLGGVAITLRVVASFVSAVFAVQWFIAARAVTDLLQQ